MDNGLECWSVVWSCLDWRRFSSGDDDDYDTGCESFTAVPDRREAEDCSICLQGPELEATASIPLGRIVMKQSQSNFSALTLTQ